MTISISKKDLMSANWGKIFSLFDHETNDISEFLDEARDGLNNHESDLDCLLRDLSRQCKDGIVINPEDDFSIEYF